MNDRRILIYASNMEVEKRLDGFILVLVGGMLTLLGTAHAGTVVSGSGNLAPGGNSVIVGGNQNTTTGVISAIISGAKNTASAQGAVINSGFQNINGGFDSVIGAGNSNEIVTGANRSVILSGLQNEVTLDGINSMIGVGTGNTMGGTRSAIVAGIDSTATSTAVESAILTGDTNTIDGTTASAIVGGDSNEVVGSTNSAILCGQFNSITGSLNSSILGGTGCVVGSGSASANNAMAGGRIASTFADDSVVLGTNVTLRDTATGSFYFGDSSGSISPKTTANRFHARFANGYYLYTNSAETLGVRVNVNGTAWSSISDRNVKHEFEDVDVVEVLEKVSQMPRLVPIAVSM